MPLAGSWTLGSFSEHLGELDAVPRPAGARRRLAPLPELGVRVGRARPRAAPGRPLARRRARARAAAAQLRGLDAARRVPGSEEPETAGPHAARCSSATRHALQARPHQHLDPRADRGAGGHGRRRLARPQGPVQGHAGRRGDRPELYREADRGVPGRLARGPRHHRRDAPDPRAATATASPGTRRSTRSTTCSALEWEPRMVNIKPSRVGLAGRARPRLRLLRASAASAPTAAARPSSAWAATTSSTWPSLFHPDTPNDVAPRGFNPPSCPTGCPTSPIELDARAHRLPLRVIEAYRSTRAGRPRWTSPAASPPSWARRASSLDLALYDVRLPGEPGDVVAAALRDAPGAAWRCGSPTTPTTTSASSRRRRSTKPELIEALPFPTCGHPRHPGPDAPQVRGARRRVGLDRLHELDDRLLDAPGERDRRGRLSRAGRRVRAQLRGALEHARRRADRAPRSPRTLERRRAPGARLVHARPRRGAVAPDRHGDRAGARARADRLAGAHRRAR